MRKLSALGLALAALAACKPDEDYKNQPVPAEPTPTTIPTKPMPAKKKVLAPEELGTCKLSATGAVTKEQTSQGGRAATNVIYWMKAEERAKMMGVDGFSLTCQGPDMKLMLFPSGKKDGMPFKPKRYEIAKGTGDANVTVTFGKDALDGVAGAVDVTAFDAHHIAGTVDLRGKLAGAREVKVAGTFDLVCPGFSACE